MRRERLCSFIFVDLDKRELDRDLEKWHLNFILPVTMMSASLGWLFATDPSLSLVLCKSSVSQGLIFTEQLRLFFVLTALWSLLVPSQKSPHLLIGILVNNSKSIHWGYSWHALQDRNAVPMAQCWHTCGDACTHLCTCRVHTVHAALRTWDVPWCSPSCIYNGGKSMTIPLLADNLLGKKPCWIPMHRISLCVYDCLGIWLWRI